MTNQSFESIYESLTPSHLQPLNQGRDCPALKARLFRLADTIASGASISDLSVEEQQLMDHVNQCGACRSLYESAVYFAQQDRIEVTRQSPDSRSLTSGSECIPPIIAPRQNRKDSGLDGQTGFES